MAINNAAFQQYLSQWVADIESLAHAVETWADNKNDVAPTFDYTTAQADLVSAKSSLETSVTTVVGL